jgi:hypothetical protein
MEREQQVSMCSGDQDRVDEGNFHDYTLSGPCQRAQQFKPQRASVISKYEIKLKSAK